MAMLDGMSRKVAHELSGTRRGISITLKMKAPANMNVEPILDKIEAFIKNQIEITVPKEQESMPLGDQSSVRGTGRLPRRVRDGKAAAAGELS